jgi:hypothetical protein
LVTVRSIKAMPEPMIVAARTQGLRKVCRGFDLARADDAVATRGLAEICQSLPPFQRPQTLAQNARLRKTSLAL